MPSVPLVAWAKSKHLYKFTGAPFCSSRKEEAVFLSIVWHRFENRRKIHVCGLFSLQNKQKEYFSILFGSSQDQYCNQFMNLAWAKGWASVNKIYLLTTFYTLYKSTIFYVISMWKRHVKQWLVNCVRVFFF